jgi:hypothetical protein
MSKKIKRKKVYRYYRRRRPKKPSLRTYLSSKLLEISIVFLTILLVLFVFSFYKKLSQPEAKEQGSLVLARTQILNGCQKEDVAQRVAERLNRMKVNNVRYQITEIKKLKDSAPKESLILDRLGDQNKGGPSEVALLTAEALGIDPQNVIYKKLDDNYRGISLTIVIGTDGEILLTQLE